MANKITTYGYFKKRLRDSGYLVDELYRRYSKSDPRAWSVIIDPGGASVFCTCYRNESEMDDNYFEIYDGGQFIGSGRVKIKTSSIEVFISYLVKYNINNKAYGYNNPGERRPSYKPRPPRPTTVHRDR